MSHKSNGRPLPAHRAEVDPEEEETVVWELVPTVREQLLTLGHACLDFVCSAEWLYLALSMGDEDMFAVYFDRYWQIAAVVDELLSLRGLKEREWDARILPRTCWHLTETLSLLVRRWLRVKEESGLAEMDLTQDDHQSGIGGLKPLWGGHERLYRSLFQEAIDLLAILDEPVPDVGYIPFEKAPAERHELVAAGHPVRLSLPPLSGNGSAATNGRASEPAGAGLLVILGEPGDNPIVNGKIKPRLTPARHDIIKALIDGGERGLTGDDLATKSKHGGAVNTLKAVAQDPDWGAVIQLPGSPGGRYRIVSRLDGH